LPRLLKRYKLLSFSTEAPVVISYRGLSFFAIAEKIPPFFKGEIGMRDILNNFIIVA
jgi:hypothetical protein